MSQSENLNQRDDIIEIGHERLERMQQLHVAFLLFDLRSENEFNKRHIKNAVHLPAGDFLEKLPQMVNKKDTPIVIYDNDGRAAGDLVLESEKLGFINVVNLLGGYQEFEKFVKI